MNKKAFTLLELIVVIAIIGFLSMVGIMTFMQWFSKSRDASRIAAMQNMVMALETSLARETELPMPDGDVKIQNSGGVLSYQGKFGTGVVKKLPEMKKPPKDPKDGIYYTYAVGVDMKSYGLLAMLELNPEVAYNPFIQEVYAANALNYEKRYPYYIGEIAVLLKEDNTPIENDKNLVSNGLNLSEETTTYKIVKGSGKPVKKEANKISKEDLGVSKVGTNNGGNNNGGDNNCPEPNINGLTKHDDNVLGCYYVADNNVIQCTDSSITDDNIKQKCIDKKANNNYTTRFYPSVEFDNIKDNTEGAIYMLYAMNGKLEIEKKSSNCSSDYTTGDLKTIVVLAALYKQVGADWELTIGYQYKTECYEGIDCVRDVYEIGYIRSTNTTSCYNWEWSINNQHVTWAMHNIGRPRTIKRFRTCYKITQ